MYYINKLFNFSAQNVRFFLGGGGGGGGEGEVSIYMSISTEGSGMPTMKAKTGSPV